MRIFLLLALFSACSSRSNGINSGEANDSSLQGRKTIFKSADGSTQLRGELAFPQGAGPFPAVVVMSPRTCEGPAGIPEGWQQATLTSWGYATFTIDSFAARGMGSAACGDFTALQPSQTIGDAYGALALLASNPRIDPRRIALLGFLGEGTTSLLSDTIEARNHYPSSGGVGFRAFFAFYPYCNLDFVRPLTIYAPIRIFAGELDDMSPANRCVALVDHLRESGADAAIIVYPGAEAGFDIVPADSNMPMRDPSALHPGATTISTHPQFSPWSENLSGCTFKVNSVFDVAKRSDARDCLRHGVHFQGDATAAEQAKNDLRTALDALMKPRP